ncbi:MAG: ornithine cyclodeaminase family protein [Woeseiaceae bacterium]|nr:ornithine cyclodeaminase family protein [Woeseiaceae bacterium]
MLTFSREQVAAALPYAELVDALAGAFGSEFETPTRSHHTVPVPERASATLLLMPAWQAGRALGVKIATVFPDNAARGIASVNASYLLLDAESGLPLAVLDGTELTLRRTACASALASRYLSRSDATTLLMVGTGQLAPHMIRAHASVRDIDTVLVWGRRREAAEAVAANLEELRIEVVDDLEAAVRRADIISCATMASEPLIAGDWLRPGQHVDLVGAFNPRMREADSRALVRSEVYVDTYGGTLTEAGEIVQDLESGAIRRDDLRGELAELARGEATGRVDGNALTLFKSVGCAIEDLAAARLVLDRHGNG